MAKLTDTTIHGDLTIDRDILAVRDVNMSRQLISTVAVGTMPLAVTSTTVCTNFNADLLDGQHGAYYAPASSLHNAVTLSVDADGNLLALAGQELDLDAQYDNLVFAGPDGGGPLKPTFRNLVVDDLPDLSAVYQASSAHLTSLAGLSYVSTSFVKMTGANTFALDTATYEPALGSPLADGYVLSSTAAGVRSWVEMAGGVTDHGDLVGLDDDDHTHYLLAAGTRALTGAWNAEQNIQAPALGIGISPTFPLHVYSEGVTSGTWEAQRIAVAHSGESTGATQIRGLYVYSSSAGFKGAASLALVGAQIAVQPSNPSADFNTMTGIDLTVDMNQGSLAGSLYGLNLAVGSSEVVPTNYYALNLSAASTVASGQTQSALYAFRCDGSMSGAGTTTHLYGAYIRARRTSGTVSTAYGLYVSTSGVMTTGYAVYIPVNSSATNDYGIYSLTKGNYFSQNVSVGTTGSVYRFDVYKSPMSQGAEYLARLQSIFSSQTVTQVTTHRLLSATYTANNTDRNGYVLGVTGLYTTMSLTGSTSVSTVIAADSQVVVSGTAQVNAHIRAYSGNVTYSSSSNNSGQLEAFNGSVSFSGTGTLATVRPGYFSAGLNNGTVTNCFMLELWCNNQGLASFGTSYLLRAYYSGAQATNCWGIHVSGEAKNYLSGKLGIGTTSPATSAILDLTSTTGALLLPRMTTAQRDALTAVDGMVLYNSTINKLQGRENAAWVSYEPALGNPGVDGYVLSSTAAGVRSWVEMTGGVDNPLEVGVDDTTVGSVYLYGPGAAASQGGSVRVFTGADYDTVIDYFSFSAYEDDLLIGPSTDTDALKLDSNKDLYITAGSLVLPASEYVNFGGTLGSTGYGIRDNAGVIEWKDSGVGWYPFNTPRLNGLTCTGTANFGVDDTTAGVINVYGHGAGSTAGGKLLLYTAADHDTTIEHFGFVVTSSGLAIGPSNKTDVLSLGSGGSVGIRVSSVNSTGLTVRGLGTTSAFWDFVTQNSTPTDNFWVRADGVAYIRTSFGVNAGANTGIKVGVKGSGTSGSTYGFVHHNSAGTLNFLTDDAGAGYLRAAAWTYSDARDKEDIMPIEKEGSLDKVLALQPKRFHLRDNPDFHLGFVAQDVASIIPEAVREVQYPGMDEPTLVMSYQFFIPVLVNAIKELNEQIQNLTRIRERM